MCGIAGICNFTGDWKENIERMKRHMKKRGPNADGTWSSEDHRVVFGHQRLSIVDLSAGGAQPMTSHSGRYTMTYNGEIYNYKELADKLLKDGSVTAFRGSSDTEVLLEAFEAYGIEKTLAFCKGMFAIGLYDHENGEITLIRDRIGEKPLYYGFVNGCFTFASDVGCFRELDGFQNPVNQKVLDLYFTYGYIPAPYSIYEQIYKLLPGTILRIRAPYAPSDPQIATYWPMEEKAVYGQEHLFTGSEQEAADELERLMKQAIAGQMVADVPVGAFLSAGIDSSTVVSLMQSLDPGKVRTFTIGMNDPKYNEAAYAKEIAQHLGTEHTEIYISDEDALAVIPQLPSMFGEPFADSSQIPTFLVSRMTREHVTVSLSGDAGDELFCGYKSYESVSRIWNKMQGVPYPLRRMAGGAILHSPLAAGQVMHDKAVLLSSRGPADLYRKQYEELDPLIRKISRVHGNLPFAAGELPQDEMKEVNHEIMLHDMLLYHPDDILVKVDRTAMAVSLETRVPLLDRDVVEFAWTLPINYLHDGTTGKKVLRNVLYRYVPQEMMNRPKKGFSIPIAKWLRQPQLKEWAEELIRREKIEQQGYLNADAVHAIWDDFLTNGTWRVQIWYILMFQQWLESIGS